MISYTIQINLKRWLKILLYDYKKCKALSNNSITIKYGDFVACTRSIFNLSKEDSINHLEFMERCKNCSAINYYDSIDTSIDKLQELHYYIGEKCNAGCKICSERYTTSDSFDVSKGIQLFIDTIKDCKEVNRISILGGETFIYKKEIIEIIPYMEKLENTRVLFHTNGTICDEELISNISRLKHVTIAFSIDGNDSTNHILRPNCEMEKIKKTIEMCKKYNITTDIINTISTLNCYDVIKNTEYYINDLHIDNKHITFKFLTIPKNLSIVNMLTKEQLDELIKFYYVDWIRKYKVHFNMRALLTLRSKNE